MPLPWPWQQEGQQACRKSSLCLFTPNRTTPQTKSPAPANCLKSFTWIICTKPNCSPGFWQKVLAYFTAKPLAPHRKWSDANRNTPFTPGGQKGPQPIVQRCFFPFVEAQLPCYWLCSFYDSNPSFPHCSPFFMNAANTDFLFIYFFTV